MYDYGDNSHLYDTTKGSWKAFRRGCSQRLIILLIFSVQQLILYYAVYYLRNEKRIIYVLGLDAVLVVYLVFGSISTKRLSSGGISVQWCLCCISSALKIVPLLFFSRNVIGERSGSFDRFTSEDYLSFIGLYPAPVIYTLLNRLSNWSLFDRQKENIIVDELLHSNLALSTALDLWDISLMLNHLLRRYRRNYESSDSSPWLSNEKKIYLIMGIITVTSSVLLGFIMPSVDSDLDSDNGELESRQMFWSNIKKWFTLSTYTKRTKQGGEEDWNNDMGLESHKSQAPGDRENSFTANPAIRGKYLDMFTIAKFTFLVGFFLIDLPFFVYRLIILIRENVLSLLIYKNLFGLVIRPYRLNLSQLAERDSAKGWQSAFFETVTMLKEPVNSKVAPEDSRLMEDSSSDSDIGNKLLSRGTRRYTLEKGRSMGAGAFVRSHTRSLIHKFTTMLSHSDAIARKQLKSRKEHAKGKHLDGDEKDYDESYDETNGPRITFASTNGEYEGVLTPQQSECYGHGEADQGCEEEKELHREMLMQKLKRTRDFPLTNFSFMLMMDKWIQLCRGLFAAEPKFDMQNEEFLVEQQRCDYFCICVAFLMAFAPRVVILIYCYAFENYVRPPRFVLASGIAGITIQEVIVYTVVVVGPLLHGIMFFRLQGCKFFSCLGLTMKEIINLCSYVTCVCCLRSIVDKPYSIIYAMQLLAFLLWPCAVLGNICLVLLRKKVNLVTFMFLACKYGIAPVMLNHKMLCLDMIKSATIMDILLYSQWNYFTYGALFRILCCSFSPAKTGVVIIISDLLVQIVYITLCQTMRALMFRKFEVHYLILRLTDDIKFNYQPPSDTSTTSGGLSSHFNTHADVDDYIKDHGLLSSPGIIFPVCI